MGDLLQLICTIPRVTNHLYNETIHYSTTFHPIFTYSWSHTVLQTFIQPPMGTCHNRLWTYIAPKFHYAYILNILYCNFFTCIQKLVFSNITSSFLYTNFHKIVCGTTLPTYKPFCYHTCNCGYEGPL